MVKKSSQTASTKGVKQTKTTVQLAKKSYAGLIVALVSVAVVLIMTAVILAIVASQSTNGGSSDNEDYLNCPTCAVPDKPIIYLYPTKSTEVSVQLSHPENFTAEYPTYGNGWRVFARPNGDLTDLNTDRELYSLYYESTSAVPIAVTGDGFVVAGSDTVDFLETTLPKLGLSPHEAEEFIIYWLPELQNNSYNYIRFLTSEEIDQVQTLTVTPQPDTVIRVLMSYQPLDAPIVVREQQIVTPERTGFVVVEWGGTKIGTNTIE